MIGGNTILTNCYTTGDVSGGAYTGGLVGGCNGYRHELTNCYAKGNIFGNGDVGGLVGFFDNNSNKLLHCYATGDVSNINNESRYATCMGGLIGALRMQGNDLSYCYATGDVISMEVSSTCGGLIGSLSGSSSLKNCYATGNVSGVDSVGGLVGWFADGANTIQNSYSTSKIIITGTAQTAYLGGLIGYAGEVTLTNVHWLYFPDSAAEYAVGYSATLGIPTNIGATKHSGIAEFYTLADTLNEGQETPAWEHTGVNTLPTLIKKENQTEEIAL